MMTGVFRRYAAHESYSLGRYEKEVHRLYAVLDKEIGERPYLASDDYSIADIATYPWIARLPLHGLAWAAVPNVKRWFDAVGARPAVASGLAVPSECALPAAATRPPYLRQCPASHMHPQYRKSDVQGQSM